MKTTILLSILGITLGVASSLFISVNANAQEIDESAKYPLVIQRLIEKFNLNETEVDSVISSAREEVHTQKLNTIKGDLDELEQQGEINADQKARIVTVFENKFKAKVEFRTLSIEERQQKMEDFRTEIESLEQETGVNLTGLLRFGHHKGRMHMGQGQIF